MYAQIHTERCVLKTVIERLSEEAESQEFASSYLQC